MKKRGIILVVLIIIAIAGIIISGYFLYSNVIQCYNKECFYNSMANCKKTGFISETTDTILAYKILGKSGDKCQINVELVQVKKGDASLSALEGKDMDCFVAQGVISDPEQNLKECHGILKEEIQNMIIQRMHAQIVENLGKVGEEITKII